MWLHVDYMIDLFLFPFLLINLYLVSNQFGFVVGSNGCIAKAGLDLHELIFYIQHLSYFWSVYILGMSEIKVVASSSNSPILWCILVARVHYFSLNHHQWSFFFTVSKKTVFQDINLYKQRSEITVTYYSPSVRYKYSFYSMWKRGWKSVIFLCKPENTKNICWFRNSRIYGM